MLRKTIGDLYHIARSTTSFRRKAALIKGLGSITCGGSSLLGFQVDCLARENLRILYSEVFMRQAYAFEASTAEPVIFDCGANIGIATLFFKWLYPKCKVTSFEPDPGAFATMQRNLARNKITGVIAHNLALAPASGHLPLYVPESGSLMTSAVPQRSMSARTVEVNCSRLSDFIKEEVDLLKMDIEGFEGPVLKELEQSGKLAMVREAFIEVHHNLQGGETSLPEVLNLLSRAGFNYHITDSYAASSDCASFQDILVHAQRASANPSAA